MPGSVEPVIRNRFELWRRRTVGLPGDVTFCTVEIVENPGNTARRSIVEATMRSFGRFAFILMALGVTGCDLTTKYWAQNALSLGQSREVITGVLDIRHTVNSDTAFSMLGGLIPLAQRLMLLRALACLGVAALVVLVFARWKRAVPIERLAWALAFGGALGNAMDRLLRGTVVDFIYVHYWPVFNVADVAITGGVALMLIASRKRSTSKFAGP